MFLGGGNENICEGESYTIAGNTYTETGSYVHDLTTASGCDSTLVLVLAVDEMPDPAYLEETICEGEFYFLGNSAYNATGLYTATVQTSGGCDSLVTLNLTVSDPETELNEIICPGESFSVGNNNYNSTGTYVENLTSSLGCDSVVTLNLQVLTPIQTNLTEHLDAQLGVLETGNTATHVMRHHDDVTRIPRCHLSRVMVSYTSFSGTHAMPHDKTMTSRWCHMTST